MAEIPPHQDRNLTWRIAIISAASALAGAFVGGLFTFLAALRQSSSQATEDRQSFVRSQRQTAYAQLATQAQALLAGVVRCDTAAIINERDANEIAKIGSSLSTAEDAVETDVATVTIIGSTPAVSRASTVRLDSPGAEGSCTALLQDLSRTGPNSGATRSGGRNLETNETILRAALNEFIAAAQRDVQR